MTARIRLVLLGEVAPLGRTTSAIDKHPVAGARRVERSGFVGDAQADRRAHGGAHKAVHCYAWAHYAWWRDALAGTPLLDAPGAFGENLSIEGIDEHDVYIGDRWRIGDALFEVSQGRQPCYKLNLRFGIPDMAARVQQSLRAGWYLRVIEPGVVAAGDRCELIERPCPDHSVAQLLALIRDREVGAARLAQVLQLPLTPNWRRLFERRMQSGQPEDWSARLTGSPG